MTNKPTILIFNPKSELKDIKGTLLEKKENLEQYKEKYVQMVLNIVGLKNHIYEKLKDIEYHELNELKRIVNEKCSLDYVKNEAKDFIENIENNIKKSKSIMENHTPLSYLKSFFPDKKIKLKGEIQMECINGAIILYFKREDDFENWTDYENTLGLSYTSQNTIIINGLDKPVTLDHELNHYYFANLFLYDLKGETKTKYKEINSTYDEILARALKWNFSQDELENTVLGKNSSYMKGKKLSFEVELGKELHKKVLKLKEKYPKDFQKILLLTKLKRIDYFL